MFNRMMTRDEVAELFGVAGLTVDAWHAQGAMYPIAGSLLDAGATDRETTKAATSAGDPGERWHITRRELAAMLNVHPDTVTRKLPEGLAAAVVERGGRGEETVFDVRLAFRWWLASEGLLNQIVLDDFRTCAARGALAIAQLPSIGLISRLMGEAAAPAPLPKKPRTPHPERRANPCPR